MVCVFAGGPAVTLPNKGVSLGAMRLTSLVFTAFAMSALCSPLSAQARLGEFLAVKAWLGTITVQGDTVGVSSAFGSKEEWRIGYTAQVSVKLDTFVAAGRYWVGKATGTATLNHQNVLTSPNGCTLTTKMIGTGAITGVGGSDLYLNAGPGEMYSFEMFPTNVPVKVTITSQCPGKATSTVDGVPERNWWPEISRTTLFSFPATGFALTRDYAAKVQFPMVLFTTVFSGQPPPQPTVNVHWALIGTAPELEMIVEPQGYDTWRPEAGSDEKTPGNDLSIKATMRYVDGTPLRANDKAQKFEFQLSGVSKEPGITMNFPLAANASSDPDLQFDASRNEGLPILVTGKDKAESKGSPQESSVVMVSAYDWGAWGAIQVTGVTMDGRRIVGYLKGDKSQTAVRLPKRAADSKIADAWKTKVGVNKPDNDDSEKEPVGLQDCDGDGLTLYEEYRGFQENGVHIEGNPNKKDLFIRNEGGSVLVPGIGLFGEVTNLEIHQDLRADEFDARDRSINGNTKDAPHRVLQHGLLLKVCPGTDGGGTQVTNQKLRARPGLVTQICIQPPGQEGSSTKLFNLAPSDAANSYEKTVAHELLHGSGVEHHGESDGRYAFELVAAGSGVNQRGKAYYMVGSVEAIVLDEKTGDDIAASESAQAEIDLAHARVSYFDMVARGWLTSNAHNDVTGPELLFQLSHTRTHYVGNVQGQHSGDDQCIMRYFFAENYRKPNSRTYYRVPPGTEPSGLILCENPAGSGVNGAGWQPIPRYADSAVSRGGCKFWVCINDAIPPGVY